MSKKISELPEYIGIPQPVGDIPISISGTTYRISPLLLQRTLQNLQSVTDSGATTTNSITANSFIKSGGTGLNVLLDNGTTILTSSILGTTNLTTSQTASNFTINSDTGNDAIVPLGNGTLAGATLNDYTTSEKNKLADTYTKGEVDTKITGVYKVKGSVANYASLPTSGRVIGDVWNLLDTGGNYVWTGTAWDELGTTVDISGKANINSPTFTGTPLAPTAAAGTNNTQIATTQFIQTAIAGKMNNPSLTGNYIPKALTTNTIGNSRLFDTGTKFGIGNTKTPTLDLTFGNQDNITIGIEQSSNTNNGKDLILKAGRTINFVEGTGFQALSTGIVAFMYGSTIVPSTQDIYIASSGDIYKRTSGAGAFVAENSSVNAQYHRGMGVDTNGSVYLCMATGGFKKKTNNAGLWVQTTATGTSGAPNCVAGDYLGNLYFGTDTALYKQTGLTGSFVSVYTGGVSSLTISPIDGSIYIITLPAVSAQILKQTAGTGSFNVIQSSAYCSSLCATISGDIYVALGGSVLGKQTAGSGLFVSQGINIVPTSMTSDSNGSLYAPVSNLDVFFLDNNAVGSVNLDGGFYKNYAGTGKGTGKSRWQVYTGQKTTSGTNLQAEILRMEINEEGLATLPSVTNALIIADTTGKSVVTKEYVASVASGLTNLSTSQTNTNFTINSDTGNDAVVPLGNGTLAGATLNDYTNAEKALVATIPNINTNAVNRDTVKLSEAVNKGQAVYVSDSNGTNIIVSKASNISEATSSKTFGLIETTGILNDIVNVVSSGLLSGLNTSTATIGDAVWLGTAGNLIFGLTNKPVAPAHLVYIGIVTRVSATVGEIFISIQNGFELREIHDILLTSLANNDGLFYDSASSLWKNKSITNVLGFSPANDSNVVHLTGTETIAGNKTLTGNTIINGNTTASPLTINAGFPAVDDGFASIVLNTFTNSAQNALEVNYTDLGVTVNVANITRVGSAYFGGGISTPTINLNNQTALTIASFDASKNLVSLSTATYPSLTELALLKGVTGSSVQTQLNGKQPLATVLTNTTASFTTALETKLAGIATGANVGVVPNTAITGATKTKITYDSKGLVTAGQDLIASDIPNIAQSQVTSLTTDLGLKQNKSLSAYSVVANSTNASANATEFTFRKWDLATYSGSLSWAQTAPTTILGASYSGQQVGNMVSINISVVYSTAGTGNLQVTLPLPSDFPTPLSPTGFTAGLDVLAYGTGQIMANTSQTVATGARGCFLRRNTANNGYEFFLNVSVATAAKVVMLNLTYQTS